MRRFFFASVRWLLWPVLALVAAMVLGSTAMQAAPSLSASENPVAIGSGQSSKMISVSWNLDGFLWATLTIKDSAQAVVGQHSAMTPTGSVPLTVFCGKSYTATLTDASNPRSVLASLVITTDCTGSRPAPTPRPEPACPGDCFTGDKVEPHGTWARFLVTTLAPVKLGVDVFPTLMNGSCNFTTSLGFASSNILSTTHDLNWLGLDANTTFCSELRATDANGAVHTKQGPKFTTLKRKVDVRFEKVFIVDDSDGGSEGDLTFAFGVNQEPIWNLDAEADTGQWVVFLGGTVPLAWFIVDDAPGTLTVYTQGCDDDSPDFAVGSGCDIPLGSNGSKWDADFAYVEKTFIHLVGPDESKPVPFEMKADGGALKFNVHGEFTASYQ